MNGSSAPGRDDWLREHPLVFVDDLDDLTLSDDDLHHLRRARRVRDGDPISVGDGRGCWLPARLGSVAEPVGAVVSAAARSWPVAVGFTPVKGAKPEWVIQKLTELGVDSIVPLETDRSVVRWEEDRERKRRERWERVVREAAMQSRQLWMPTVDSMSTPARFAERMGGGVLAEPGGATIGAGERSIMIGPEGGWSDDELELGRTVRLPGGILRAETAAIVAAALLVGQRESQNA